VRFKFVSKISSKTVKIEFMKMHLLIRRFAGAFVLLSLLLAHYHSPYWLWFTAFVGFNLLQSSFTNFCPLEMILKKLGIGKEARNCCEVKQPTA
jgi:hypothetical protein